MNWKERAATVEQSRRNDREVPPSMWCDWWPGGVTCVTDDTYYGWPQGEEHPWFWHWCTKRGRWVGAGTDGHDLLARDPLHLEPSLPWPCCGLHGWLRQGTWEPA